MFHLTEKNRHRLSGLKVGDAFTYWEGYCLEEVKRIAREHGLIIQYSRPRTKLYEQFGSFTCSVIWKARETPCARENKVFDLYLQFKAESKGCENKDSLAFAYMLDAYSMGIATCQDFIESHEQNLDTEEGIGQTVAAVLRIIKKAMTSL